MPGCTPVSFITVGGSCEYSSALPIPHSPSNMSSNTEDLVDILHDEWVFLLLAIPQYRCLKFRWVSAINSTASLSTSVVFFCIDKGRDI